MAVFSLIVLLILLVAMALLSLRPWEDLVDPQVRISPEVGIGVGDAAVAAGRPGPALADANVAGGQQTLAAAEPAVEADAASGSSSPRLAIGQALAVSSSPSTSRPAAPPSPTAPQPPVVPIALPPPSASPVETPPVSLPVIAKPGGSRGGIGAAGEGVGPPAVDGGIGAASFELREGVEYGLSFSFLIEAAVYGEPGSENSIVRLLGDAAPDPSLGLQLRDFAGDNVGEGGRGLWSRGGAMGADRFLAPVAEGEWHEATVRFRVSSGEEGFYEIHLDGLPVDAGYELATVAAGTTAAHVDLGLFREQDGDTAVPAIRFDAVELGIALESMLP